MRGWLKRVFAPAPAAAPAVSPSPAVLSAAWASTRRQTPATYASISDEEVERARRASPEFAHAILDAAERALRHEFDLLGSGPYVPIDPDRPPRGLYRPIDWLLDPVRNLRFAARVPHKEWGPQCRPGNADIKYPWELARCQHWVTLAQASRLTGDPRFAREIADELDDFVEANPLGIGVNWTCTMDVGLRAVNWALSFDIVRSSSVLTGDDWVRAYRALADHGRFIRANLENTYEVTSNHFLSNVAGLWFLGSVFADHDEGREWLDFARAALEKEIDVQVLPDGADFESSVPYHRLVTELFLGCARLADHRGAPLSAHYRERVAGMLEYLHAVERPDGLMPQSGDADDGRLHVFTGLGVVAPQDGRHLLGPGGVVFNRPDWIAAAGALAGWEAAWWGLGPVANRSLAQERRVVRLFPDAGHAVARRDGQYLLVTNSIVGTNGFGNHKHNDQLSFEYHANGSPIVVDPGSFVYTPEPAARNLFRSTRYHNTVCVDGVEQNEINPEWLFRTFEKAKPAHISFEKGNDVIVYTGRHVGYERLTSPVRHQRTFTFNLRTGVLEIVDTLSGSGRHHVNWHFHFAPGVGVEEDGHGWLALLGHTRVALRHSREFPQGNLGEGWYSPSYGRRVRCVTLDCGATMELAGTMSWTVTFTPQEAV